MYRAYPKRATHTGLSSLQVSLDVSKRVSVGCVGDGSRIVVQQYVCQDRNESCWYAGTFLYIHDHVCGETIVLSIRIIQSSYYFYEIQFLILILSVSDPWYQILVQNQALTEISRVSSHTINGDPIRYKVTELISGSGLADGAAEGRGEDNFVSASPIDFVNSVILHFTYLPPNW